MKINFGKIGKVLKAAPAVIAVIKGTVDAIKGKDDPQDQIEIGAESLIQMLPIIEASLNIDVADNEKWNEAVRRVLSAEQATASIRAEYVAAIAALTALIDDIKARRHD